MCAVVGWKGWGGRVRVGSVRMNPVKRGRELLSRATRRSEGEGRGTQRVTTTTSSKWTARVSSACPGFDGDGCHDMSAKVKQRFGLTIFGGVTNRYFSPSSFNSTFTCDPFLLH